MNPNVPSGNNNQFFGQKVSKPGINVNNAGDNELIYKNDYNRQIYYNSSGVPTVLTGLRTANQNNNIDSNEQGFFVSQPGIDVTQATDNQLIFNSSQNIFKIVGSGTLTLISPDPLHSNTTVTVAFAHNLGYVPAFLGFITGSQYLGSDVYLQTPYTVTANIVSGTPEPITYSLSADISNIYANVYNGGGVGISGVGTTTFKYYLLQETAS